MRRALAGLPAPLGFASVVLFVASLRWAHHWGQIRTDALVAGWSIATLGALTLGIAYWRRGSRLAKLGFALGVLSVLALGVAGAAWATGYDPAGACGGG